VEEKKKNRIMIKDTKNKICNDIIVGGKHGTQWFCGHPAGSRHCECVGPSECTQLSFHEFKEKED
jgi:hypothetical protein